MQSLSKALASLETTLKETASPSNSYPTPVRGSTENAITTIILKNAIASQPRTEPLTVEKAKSAWAWLQRLKSCRTVSWHKNQTTNRMTRSIGYTLPDDITPQQAKRGLMELLKPCNAKVTEHFVTLQAFKPFYDADLYRIKIVFDGLYKDVKDMPEIAVVLVCEELRNCEDRSFPVSKVLPTVSKYRDIIFDTLDYFEGDK